jgi:hypothetical protein
MDAQEELYIKAFNNGYLLAKHEPELAAKLTAQKNGNSEYFKALVSGKKEFEKEAEIQQWLNNFSKGKPARDDRDLNKER